MGSTGKTVGTVGGAAIGTAIAPGVGTVLGGLAGGVIGGMFDGSDAPPPPDPNNFKNVNTAQGDAYNQQGVAQRTHGAQLQAGNANQGAQQLSGDTTMGATNAQKYGQLASTAQRNANYQGAQAAGAAADQSAASQGAANDSYYQGIKAQGRQAPQIASSDADQQRQLAALGGMQSSADKLQQMGSDGLQTGVAQAQLQQGQDAAMAQSLAMAGSGRSLGSGAGSMRQALDKNAQLNAQTNQAASVANLQEQHQNQQFQLGALGQAQQGYSNVAGQTNNIRGSNDQMSNTNAQLNQSQQGINNQTQSTYDAAAGQQANNALGYSQLGNQTALGYDQLGAQQAQTYNQLGANQGLAYQQLGQGQNLAYNQLGAQQNAGYASQGLAYDQMGQKSDEDQLNANMAYENLKAGNSIAGMNASNQSTANNMGMITGLAGAAATMYGSDRDAKQNIKPANKEFKWGPLGKAIGFGSDDEGKKQFHANITSSLPSDPAEATKQRMGYAMAQGQRDQADHVRLQRELDALQNGTDHQFDSGLEPARTGFAPVDDMQIGPHDRFAVPGNDNGYTMSDVHSKREIASLRSELDRTYAALQAPPANETTPLSREQEPGFQQWLKQNHVQDLDNPDSHYDYRGAYLAGVGRGADSGHFTDQFKQHGHPTFSNESQYSQSANDGGSWDGDRYMPQVRPQAPNYGALDQARLGQGGSFQGRPQEIPTGRFPDTDLRPAAGYSYEYKDPDRFGQGRFYGPIAQDLEKTPAGASTVKKAPDGTKMVDTSRLSLVNTSAISEQQKRMDALEKQLAALSMPDMDRIQQAQPGTWAKPSAPDDQQLDAYQQMARQGGR